MSTITVYSTGPSCMRCRLTERVLTQHDIDYVVVNIRDAEEAARYVTDELGYTEAPVVVVSDDHHWSGFRPDLIEKL